MRIISPFIIASLLLATHITVASGDPDRTNPLWTNYQPNSIALPVLFDPANDTPPPAPTAQPQQSYLLQNVPQTVDAEITALAAALNNDPLEIFNHVRNHIHYEHYYGSRKGAVLTLLEGSGNDLDQCILLAKLLEASGATNSIEYRRGRHRMALTGHDGINVYDFLGIATTPFPGQSFQQAFGFANPFPIADEEAKHLLWPLYFTQSRGTPSSGNTYFPDYASIAFYRIWLRVNIGGTFYELDPSFKTYAPIAGVNLLAATGYDRAALLAAAGGTTGTGSIRNLNESAIHTYLTGISQDILTELHNTYPNLSLAEIISGRRIVEHHITDLSDAFPLQRVFSDRIGETNITGSLSSYQTTVRFQRGSINYVLPTAELQGRRITLTHSGNTIALRFDDDAPVATTQDTGSDYSLTITVTHPGGIGSWNETKTYQKQDAFIYSILYGFSPSGNLLQKRNEQLNAYLNSGLADNSREVRSELLNVMGLTWLYQTHLVDRLLAAQNDVDHIAHHRFGRMAQEQGFYVDVGLQLSGALTREGPGDEKYDNVFQLGSLFASALEHGIIEQQQPNASAVSTVNILRLANAAGQKLFLTDSSNWATVQNQLGSSYASLLPTLTDEINQGARLFLPENATVNQGIWTGTGYIVRRQDQAGMIISGGYSGGFSTNPGTVVSNNISTTYLSSPTYNYSEPSIYRSNDVAPAYATPDYYGSDPVDMATGAFIFANTDLVTGTEPAPRGLSFSRTYRSLAAGNDTQHIGYGWTHNFHIRATERTATEEVLGLGTSEQTAGLLTAALVSADLYRANANAKEWATAAQTVGWFVDSIQDNAVAITIGHDVFQFIQQPDGTYQPPTGSTFTLTKPNGAYQLQQRLGNSIHFDTAGKATSIVDVDGKTLHFAYHGDDRLNYVEDAYGRRYTFGYDSNNRITSVTDSTGRSVAYRYDAEGNLDRYTDPEGKYFYHIYAAATDPHGATPVDPSGTTADEHKIVRLRNHDLEIITQNVYDAFGRVYQQYLHGDTNKTFHLAYTGYCSTETNPEGGVTQYFYDERGRAIGQRDPEGNATSMQYDGQDHVIKSTSATGEVTVFTYDANHNVTRIDYPRGGGSTINTYDALNRLDTTMDPEGNITDVNYFTSGFHSGKNRPQQVIDPENITTFTYYSSGAAAGRIHTITDGDGLLTTHAYDSFSHPDYTDAPGGFRTDFHYDARGDLDYVDDPNGVRTDFTYNDRRQLTQILYDQSGPDEATENRTYDNQGRLATTLSPPDKDGQRVEQRFEYTPTDKIDLECLTNDTPSLADDIIVDYEYDGRDYNYAVTDALNRQTDMFYFDDGALQQMARPGARNTTYTYDSDNRIKTQTNPGSNADRMFEFSYEVTDTATGDLTSGYPKTVFTDADDTVAISEFDRNNRLCFYSNKRGYFYEFRYDGLGRKTDIITPLDAANNRATTFTYNHRGDITTLTEPSGQVTTFTYNPTTGRPASQADSSGVITYNTFDDNGNLLSSSEGTNTISRTYDNLNRVKTYTDINGQQVGYRNHKNGKLHKIIYPGGTENGIGHVEYTYWQDGRLKHVIDKLTTTTRTSQFYWYNDGRLQRIERPNGTIREITYDAAGRPALILEKNANDEVLASYDVSYYASDELQSLTATPAIPPTALTPPPSVMMTYDEDNRLATFERPWLNSSTDVLYDADGNMTYGPYPDASITSYVYDSRNRLIMAGDATDEPQTNDSSLVWSGGPFLFDGTLENIVATPEATGISGNDAFTTMAFVNPGTNPADAYYGNALFSWGTSSTNQGNFLYYNSDEQNFEYGFFNNDAQTAGDYPQSQGYHIAVTYDGTTQRIYVNGAEVSSRVPGDLNMVNTVALFGIDAFYQFRLFTGTMDDVRIYNRALSATEIDAVAKGRLLYTYDHENNRMRVTGGGDTITYVNDPNQGLNKVLRRTKNGQTTQYIWGLGLLYEIDANGNAVYYHYDQAGNTTMLTNEYQSIIELFSYTPYGQVTFDSDYDTPFLFTGFFGNQTDSNGLIHMRARYYNPLIKRFINADPAKAGWNWHAYANGNPLFFVDPTGLGNQSVLDSVQDGLSYLGLVPAFGAIPDIINTGISLGRGNFGDAAINAAAIIPVVGQAATVGKIGVKTVSKGAKNVLSKGERLNVFFDDLHKLPTAKNADEALSQVNSTLTKVEDKFSGLPNVPPAGKVRSDRMFPPQADSIIRNADGSITATSKGNVTHIGPNGSILITTKNGVPVFQKGGAR